VKDDGDKSESLGGEYHRLLFLCHCLE